VKEKNKSEISLNEMKMLISLIGFIFYPTM